MSITLNMRVVLPTPGRPVIRIDIGPSIEPLTTYNCVLPRLKQTKDMPPIAAAALKMWCFRKVRGFDGI